MSRVIFCIRSPRSQVRLFCLVASLLFLSGVTHAQSTDPTFPTPVGSREIDGAIPARDIGDARLTDQYYGFSGLPGDFFITVDTRNLNGDFDIFTAGELRPLLKITVYAESTTPVTKNIYLRRRESLILRVEGRTPNDDDATYKIRFSGSFEPISGGVILTGVEKQTTENEGPPSRTGSRKGTRVSSSGARIEEPPTEIAATPTPAPTPIATPSPGPERTESAESTKRTTTKNSRPEKARKPVAKPASPATTETKSAEAKDTNKGAEPEKAEKPKTTEPSSEAASKSSTEAKNKPETAESETKPATSNPENKPSTTGRTNTRRNSDSARNKSAKPDQTGARLVIEQKDGIRVEYPMNMVTRVTVEKGQILILKNDGELVKVSMSNVARMSIGP